MSNINSNSSVKSKVVDSVCVSLPKAAVSFGLGHPFDLVKTRMQANPGVSSFNVTANIWKQYKFVGFYKGGIANFSRAITKEFYRSPLRGGKLYFLTQYCPNWSKETKSLVVGLSMAVTDTMIACPLERLKVWMMTDKSRMKHSMKKFFTDDRKGNELNLFRNLYKGSTVSLMRSAISWVSYLVPEVAIRDKTMHYFSLQERDINFKWNCLIGMSSGCVNGICTLPFDTIKTRLQMEGNKKKVSMKGMLEMAQNIVKSNGISGFYRGFNVKLIHYMIVGIITADVINKVDAVWNEKPKTL